MQEQEEEDQPEEQADTGAGGIRLGKRLGYKKQKGGVERSGMHKKVITQPKMTGGAGLGYDEKDIEFMKNAIQQLCQSANPLGKSIDFVTEDVDSMVKEYQNWQSEFASSNAQLVEQQRVTEETIQPLQDELAQIEEKISEQTSKIQNLRRQIIWNDSTISNLLNSVISTT